MRNQPDFKEIYQEFQPKIRHYLSRMLGDQAAEDIAQEIFAKISRSLDSFKCLDRAGRAHCRPGGCTQGNE